MFSEIEFIYPAADAEGKVIEQRHGKARQFSETLAPGLTLDQVAVPVSGNFFDPAG